MKLLTFEDVWDVYRISRSTLLKWEKTGVLKKVVKLPNSGHRRYLIDDLELALGIGG